MNEPTNEQLKELYKDIMSGDVMTCTTNHYNQLEERIKELEGDLSFYGNHKSNCKYILGLKAHKIEDCDCGFDLTLKVGK